MYDISEITHLTPNPSVLCRTPVSIFKSNLYDIVPLVETIKGRQARCMELSSQHNMSSICIHYDDEDIDLIDLFPQMFVRWPHHAWRKDADLRSTGMTKFVI